MLFVVLVFSLAAVVSAQTLTFGGIRPGENCTASSQCLRDFYNCRLSTCTAGGVCEQNNIESAGRTSCADLRNATNYDYCLNGVCVGSSYPSTWVHFTLNSNVGLGGNNAPNDFTSALLSDYDFPINLQASLVSLLANSTDGVVEQPNVRTCFDFDQTLQTSIQNNQQVVRTCQLVLCPTTDFFPCVNPFLYVEFVGGPGNLDHAALAQAAAVAANNSQLTSFNILSGYVDASPFGRSAFQLPNYIGIAIGVACALFVLTILLCCTFYCVKSRREIYDGSVLATDSTASVQSGSSMRSESHASAME